METHYPDCLIGAPKVHKLIFENDAVRVCDVNMEPGETAPWHRHPRSMLYIMTDAHLRMQKLDEEAKDVTVKVGEVVFNEPLVHQVSNIGQNAAHILLVELKK
jgi:quercetin dioxygenase-like cupin family protein